MITIRDVARAAGVSVATVSRVQNGSILVKEATRRRVGEIVARLGYSPHVAARSLITSRTSTLGVLLPGLYGEFFSEVIRGIDQTAQREGYHLLVSSSHNDRLAVEAALRSMRGRVDGLIVMSPEMDSQAAVRNLPPGFPLVLLNCPGAPTEFDILNIDNLEGARAMTGHFLALGHRRVAIIKGPERNFDAAERLRGYRAALGEAGLRPSPELEIAGDFSEASGFLAIGELIRRCPPGPTAVFAANDSMAIGALCALREAGLRVPDDIALAGFDDVPMSRYLDPPLSSVHVDISQLGERATGRLLRALEDQGRHHSQMEILPTRLVIRRSSEAPPASQAFDQIRSRSNFCSTAQGDSRK
jgi:LacI family transcriptional regulator